MEALHLKPHWKRHVLGDTSRDGVLSLVGWHMVWHCWAVGMPLTTKLKEGRLWSRQWHGQDDPVFFHGLHLVGSQSGLVIFHWAKVHLVFSPNGELVDEPLRLAAAVGTKVANDNRTTGRQQKNMISVV